MKVYRKQRMKRTSLLMAAKRMGAHVYKWLALDLANVENMVELAYHVLIQFEHPSTGHF